MRIERRMDAAAPAMRRHPMTTALSATLLGSDRVNVFLRQFMTMKLLRMRTFVASLLWSRGLADMQMLMLMTNDDLWFDGSRKSERPAQPQGVDRFRDAVLLDPDIDGVPLDGVPAVAAGVDGAVPLDRGFAALVERWCVLLCDGTAGLARCPGLNTGFALKVRALHEAALDNLGVSRRPRKTRRKRTHSAVTNGDSGSGGEAGGGEEADAEETHDCGWGCSRDVCAFGDEGDFPAKTEGPLCLCYLVSVRQWLGGCSGLVRPFSVCVGCS